MSDGIFLIQGKDNLVEMTARPYDSEDFLQALLARFPEIIPGGQIDETDPRRWLLVSREMPVPAEDGGGGQWSLDHLFLDQDGVPTLVEVKRGGNPEARRLVVAQMLDYAANGVLYWSRETIQNALAKRLGNNGQSVDEEIASFLDGEEDVDGFWSQVMTNLQAGKIRLIFLADQIPRELRRIVEFLNEQMDPAEVLAIEVKQYVGEGGAATLVSRLVGQTAFKKQHKTSGPGRPWDEDRFFAALTERCEPEIAGIGKKLYDWSLSNMDSVGWGRGKHDGSFKAIARAENKNVTIFVVFTSGIIDFYFGGLASCSPFDRDAVRADLLAKLKGVPGLDLPDDAVDRYPKVSLSQLKSPGALDDLFGVLSWVREQLSSSDTSQNASHADEIS